MYTIVLIMTIMIGGKGAVIEDVGIYHSKERCETVAKELHEKADGMGRRVTTICIPTDEQTEA